MTLRIALLGGAAIGVFSALFFVSLAMGTGPVPPAAVSALICAALAWWVRIPAPHIDDKKPWIWLVVTFFAVVAAALGSFVLLGFKEANGAWDAWTIWNLHARFIARGGAQWNTIFSLPSSTQPGYPLLLPAFIAQIWTLLRSEPTIVPFLTALFFTFGTTALLVGAVRQFRGWGQGMIAGAFLLGTTDFLVQGAAQYADVPLSFYILAALLLLCFEDMRCTILAGAMAGFAAWTKNEGLLFLLVLLAARAIARWRAGKISGIALEVGQLIIGAAPVLAVVALFKFRYAPANDLLFGHKPGEILAHAADFGRYVTTIEGFVKCTALFGELLVPAVLVLGAYAWLVRFRVAPEERMNLTTIVAAAVLMLSCDFVVYVLFPNDLVGLINTSIARVFMQVWPAALFAFFWASRPVDLRPVPPTEKETKQMKKAAATRRR